MVPNYQVCVGTLPYRKLKKSQLLRFALRQKTANGGKEVLNHGSGGDLLVALVSRDMILVPEHVIKEVSIIRSVVDDCDLLHIGKPNDGTENFVARLYGNVRFPRESGHLCATHALSHNRVALTTHRSQTLGIQNRDLSPADLDEAGTLQQTSRDRDARAPRCEQSCDEVVR